MENLKNERNVFFYKQPYANLSFNSLCSIVPSDDLTHKGKIELELKVAKDTIKWLFGSSDPSFILVGSVYQYSLLDISENKEIMFDYIKVNTSPYIIDDKRYCYLRPHGHMVVKSIKKMNGDKEVDQLIYLPAVGVETKLYGFFSLNDLFIMHTQNFGNPANPHYKRVDVFCKTYEQRDVKTKWILSFNDYSYFSPAMSDGTLLLYFDKSIEMISPEGTKIKSIQVSLLPGTLSVDPSNQLWGFQRKNDQLYLIGFDNSGAEFINISLTISDVKHPPIIFPNGRVVVIGLDKVECMQAGKVIWSFEINGDDNPMATGVSNGDLFVKANSKLYRINKDGEKIWELETPNQEPITSNILVAADGSVYFASVKTIYSFAK